MLGLIKQAWTLAGASQAAAGLRVPIGGLPGGASTFEPGFCYSIGMGSEAAYWGFVRRLVEEVRDTARAGRVLAFGDADGLPALPPSSGLLVLEMAETGGSEILRAGAEGLLECIEETLLPPGGLLLIADPESCCMDIERAHGGFLDALADWVKAWNHTAVFLARLQDVQATCTPFALARFGGVASMVTEGERLYWRIGHWQRPGGGRIIRAALEIRETGGGWPEALGAMADTAPAVPLAAPDENRVIVTREIADFDRKLPPAWEVLDDFYDFEDYLTGAEAPALVLAFGQGSDFERLARLVEQIRHAIGDRVKLVLRETDLRLRRYQERILLRAGLNQVVRAYEGTPVLRAAVEALRGVRSPVLSGGNELEHLLRASKPPELRGYLPPLAFCEALLGHLQGRSTACRGEFIRPVLATGANKFAPTDSFAIDHALVKLKLLPGMTLSAALAAYRPKRQGDLVTAEGGRLYVFLFGCGRADIPASLADGFPPDVRAYLLLAREWTETPAILESLRALATAWAQPEPTDDAAQRAEAR